MRIMFANFDYPDFLVSLYAAHPGLDDASYREQMRVRNDSLFGTADFFTRPLCAAGHEAVDLHVNNEHLQRIWVRERKAGRADWGLAQSAAASTTTAGDALPQDDLNNVVVMSPFWERHVYRHLQNLRAAAARTPLYHLRSAFRPITRLLDHKWVFRHAVAEMQIKAFRPDVLVVQAVYMLPTDFLQRIRPYVGMIVAQHAGSELSPAIDYSLYDLAVSAFPPTLDFFAAYGVAGFRQRLGFDPIVLDRVPLSPSPDIDVSFVGSLFSLHNSRRQFLEEAGAELPQLTVWSAQSSELAPDSSLKANARPAIWGQAMFDILARSKITLNHHGDFPPFANNMRLFEATGMGCLLVTDWLPDLHELFEPEKEVITFRSVEECVTKVRWYLDHDAERRRIAEAGQARTMRDHSYERRALELIGVCRDHLARKLRDGLR